MLFRALWDPKTFLSEFINIIKDLSRNLHEKRVFFGRWLRLIDFNDHAYFHKHGSKGREYEFSRESLIYKTIHISRRQQTFHLNSSSSASNESRREECFETPKSASLSVAKRSGERQAVDEAMRQTTMMTSTSIICRVLINISSFLMTYFSSSHPSRVEIGLLHPNVYSFSK